MEQLNKILNLAKENKLRTVLLLILLVTIGFGLYNVGLVVHERLDLATLKQLIKDYGYYLIFTLVMLGNMGVPVPEESPVIMAGFAAHEGILDYKWAVAVCIFSAILGDNIGYMIGRKGGRALILRYGQYVGINEEKLKKFEGFFERYGAKTVFIARFVAGLRWVAGPLSGAAHMPLGRFMIYNASGAVVWVLIMTQLGYHFGHRLPWLLKMIGRTNGVVVVIALIIFVLYYRHKKLAKQQAKSVKE